jgi:hypothetical protein
MKCGVCNETELEGELGVLDDEATAEGAIIALLDTAPRSYIVCDSCRVAVCKNCCSAPKTGYCDRCTESHNLLDSTEESEAGYP